MRNITPLKFSIIGLLHLFISLIHGSKCPPQESISRHVICYYEGRTSLNNLNVCNCTHIIFTDITRIADNYTLDIFEDAKSDLAIIRGTKPDLPIIFTLKSKPEQSSTILKSESKRERLTNGIAGFLRDSGFNGVEINFGFSSKDGATKESLVSFLKVLRNTLDSTSHKRIKREGYDVFEKLQDDVTTAAYSTQRTKNIREKEKPQQKVRITKRVKSSRTTREERRDKDVDFYDDDGGLAPVDEDFQEAPIRRVSRRRKELENSGLEEENETIEESGNNFLIFVRLSVQPEIIAKKYDLKALSKYADLLMVPTHNIVDETERHVTYHPSRLMGLSDMLNTDSILDLLTGLGAPKSKIVISMPTTVLQHQLADPSKNTPRSPTLGDPKFIDQSQLCSFISEGDWTIERDDDLTAPYAFSNKTWLAFEDKTSINIKGKYILLRELAGGAIYPIDADVNEESCKNETGNMIGGSITNALFNNFRSLERKPRALVLESLQNEIHDTSFSTLEAGIHLSEYRIVRVVDHSGAVHVIRKNTKTQFECSRQGYFSHPLGCNKFYRCVKFNQYSDDFTVFEYDCPAGLAFDERWEVCVWPGSLPHGAPCTGSSEIAPVPRSHYQCPNVEGYYADPENCRWFFACLDHARDGITPLTAYEFRCPFGLVFDEGKLACDWPWLVGGCGARGISGVLISKHAGVTTNIHQSTFINGGNLAASYGQYAAGQDAFLTGFGASYENAIHEASGFGFKSQSQSSYSGHTAGANYIASSYDDNQNKAAFATIPDYEISGGRILNQGGVVLNQNLNLVGVSGTGSGYDGINQYANIETQKIQNSINVKTAGYQSSGYAYEKPAVKFELPLQHIQPPIVQTVAEKAVLTKLEPTLYQYPLSTPRPFSVDIPSVQVNEEKSAGYSSQTIISSTPQTIISSTPQTFISSTPETYVSSTPQTIVSSTPQTIVTAAKAVSEGYVYEKPAIQLQLPVVTPKPEVHTYQQVNIKQNFEGYSYEKPQVQFELPIVTPRPEVHVQQVQTAQPVITQNELVHSISLKQPRVQFAAARPFSLPTPKPIAYEQPIIQYQPIAIKSKQIVPSSTPLPTVSITPSQEIYYEHTKGVSITSPIIHEQKSYVTPVQISSPRPFSYQQEIVQPVQISTPRPVIYEQKQYLPPVQVSTPKIIYETPKIAVSTARPFVYEQKQFVSTQRPVVYEQQYVSTPKPIIYEQRVQPVQVSTPRPFVVQQVQKVHQVQPVKVSTPRPVIYTQRLQPVKVEAPKPIVQVQQPVVYSKPTLEYLPPETPKSVLFGLRQRPLQQVTYQVSQPKPVVYEQQQYVQVSTPQPVVTQREYLPPVQVSTVKPVVYEQKQYVQPVQISTPKPVVYQQQYVQVSTPQPIVTQKQYLPPVQVSTPKPVVYEQQQYVRVSSPQPVVTQREYLPPVQVSTVKPVVYQQEFVQVSSPQPTREYLPPVQVTTPKAVVYEQKQIVQPVISTPKPVVYQQEYVQVSTPQPVVTQREYLPPVQVSTPKPVVYEQQQYVRVSSPQPVVTQREYLPPVQVTTPKPVVYEQKQIIQQSPKPVVYQQQYVTVSTPQPVVTKEYLPPVQVSTPRPIVYEQKQVVQPIRVTTEKIYHQEFVTIPPKVQVSTPKPVIYRQQYIQPVSRPQEIFYKPPQQTVIYQQKQIQPVYKQPVEISTQKVVYEQQKVVQEVQKPIIVEQRYKQRQRPVVYQEQYEIQTPKPAVYEQREYLPPVQVSTQREYLPPSTTESVIVQEPVVYTQKYSLQGKSRSRYRAEEFVKKTKESNTVYVESYEKSNPAISVLQKEVVQPISYVDTPVQPIVETYTSTSRPIVVAEQENREYLPPLTETFEDGSFEFQKISAVQKIKTHAQNIDTGYVYDQFIKTENVTSGYEYSSPATVKYGLNSNIEIAPPPQEYLIDVTQRTSTTTAKLPEYSSRYSARTRSRVRVRPTTSTEASLEYSAPEYLPPSSENYPVGYRASQRRRPSSKKTKTTVLSIGEVDKKELDDENVEVLLDKYSGKFGDLLDEDKEKFITKVIQGDAKGKIKVGKEPEVSTVGYEITSSRSRQRGRGRKYGSSSSTTTTTEEYNSELEYTTINDLDDEDDDKDTADVSLTSLDLKNLKLKKDKKTVIVVSQVSDANPILIGKLASQCSCQSNNVELKKERRIGSGRRTNTDNDYETPDDSNNNNDYSSTTESQRRGRTRRPKISDTVDSIAFDGELPNVDYRSNNDPSEATILIGGPRGRSRTQSRYRTSDGNNPDDDLRYGGRTSTAATLDVSRKVPVTTEALFLPEKANGRRIPSRSRARNENYRDASPNDISSIPLFSPIPADEIASTVDYALVKGRKPNDNEGGRKSISGGEGSKVAAGAAFDRYGPGGWRGADETLQGSVDCKRPGLFRHPKYCNKFYACNYDPWKKRYTLHVFNCPIHLAYDSNLGACNWPSKGPACSDDNLLV